MIRQQPAIFNGPESHPHRAELEPGWNQVPGPGATIRGPGIINTQLLWPFVYGTLEL